MLEVFRQLEAALFHGLHVEAAGAVGRAHQRAGHDAAEAELLGQLGVGDEFLWAHPALNRVEARAGAQVLGDGDDVAARVVQVAHRLLTEHPEYRRRQVLLHWAHWHHALR